MKFILSCLSLLAIVQSKGTDQNPTVPANINPNAQAEISPAQIRQIEAQIRQTEEANALNHVAFPRLHAAVHGAPHLQDAPGRTITTGIPSLRHNRIAEIASSDTRIADQSAARAAVGRRLALDALPRPSPLNPMSPTFQQAEGAALEVFERLARLRPQ